MTYEHTRTSKWKHIIFHRGNFCQDDHRSRFSREVELLAKVGSLQLESSFGAQKYPKNRVKRSHFDL